MLKKLILTAVLLAAPLALTQTASADHFGCYSPYRGPAVTYRAPIHAYSPYGVYGRSSLYRSYYAPVRGYGYRVPVRAGYSPYGIYNRYPYYGRGTSIGVNRGGVSLYFGF